MLSKWPKTALFLTALSASILHDASLQAKSSSDEQVYPAYGPFYTTDRPGKSKNGEGTTRKYGPFYADSHQKKRSHPCKIRPLLEAKAGYFFFSDSKMRKIYNQEGLDLQIAGTYPIWKWFQLYASAEYLEKQGRSLFGHNRTRIWEYPFTLGIQTVACINYKLHYYFTVAPRYIYVHQHNNTREMDRKMNHQGVGLFLGTGFHIYPMEHFVIDLFGEYSYCRMHFHTHRTFANSETAQVGGFTFGGGLGYAF